MSGDEDKGFKVTDKRIAAEEAEVSAKSEAEARADEAEAKAAEAAAAATGEPIPPADFSTLILSLSTSALVHLGVVANPDGSASPKNLGLAKHTIDLLALLEHKTRGNLTGEEEQLLNQVLYDLRMRFVGACKG